MHVYLSHMRTFVCVYVHEFVCVCVCVCVSMYVNVCACACACVSERERQTERERIVCVRERQRESACVRVCVRTTERERESVRMWAVTSYGMFQIALRRSRRSYSVVKARAYLSHFHIHICFLFLVNSEHALCCLPHANSIKQHGHAA